MINKIKTAQEAVAGVKDGMTIMVGGFLATGSPEILMDALVEKGVKHLTVIIISPGSTHRASAPADFEVFR